MKPQHTPTPWKVFTAINNDNKILGIGKEDTGEGITAYNGTLWGTDEEAAANAAFIVKAVNQRQELLDLLLAALPYVEEGEAFNKPTKKDLSKKIRAIVLEDE